MPVIDAFKAFKCLQMVTKKVHKGSMFENLSDEEQERYRKI